MKTNKLIIAGAGSGKTTYIVNQALRHSEGNTLITTYTQENANEIRRKIIAINKFVPQEITIQTWFSFLLQHGVRPYQGKLTNEKIKGLVLVNQQSGYRLINNGSKKIYYSEEKNLKGYYFTEGQKIYSDKLSKFVIRCNKESEGETIRRIQRIYSHVFVDEVQDLAGYDLEILKLLFQSSISVTMVGDPRQVTYLTHPAKLHSKYRNGDIKRFLMDHCKDLAVTIDEALLGKSHRNNRQICDLSSRLYPSYEPTKPCECLDCRSSTSNHQGVFLVKEEQVLQYTALYSPIVLKYSRAGDLEWNYGMSKGLGFERILIYPTKGIRDFLRYGILMKTEKGQEKPAFDIAKFYVALTRARLSVGIVVNYSNEEYIDEVEKWSIFKQSNDI